MRAATGGLGPCWRVPIRGGGRVVSPIVDAPSRGTAEQKAVVLATELIGRGVTLTVYPAVRMCAAGRHIGGGAE